MMTILSAIFGSLTGPLLRVVTIPLLCAAALVGFHTLVENWKGNLRAEGERTCDARWEREIREEERNKAAEAAAASRSILEAERRNNEELSDELDQIKLEADALRALSGGSVDGRCLSDGVFDALSKHGAGPRGRDSHPAKGGAAVPAAEPRKVPENRTRPKG